MAVDRGVLGLTVKLATLLIATITTAQSMHGSSVVPLATMVASDAIRALWLHSLGEWDRHHAGKTRQSQEGAVEGKRAWENSQRGRPPVWALEDEQDVDRQKEKDEQAPRPQDRGALASGGHPNILRTECLKHSGKSCVCPSQGVGPITESRECVSGFGGLVPNALGSQGILRATVMEGLARPCPGHREAVRSLQGRPHKRLEA